jgi:putative acetyltransferase
MNPIISLQLAEPSDITEMQKICVDTISTICKDDYSPEQIRVWVSSIQNKERWVDKLASQYFLVAKLDNRIIGFASLENNDCVDMLYVHKDYQRQGIADRLFSEIEKEVIKKGGTVLVSDVSKTARPFFEKKGFKMLKEQKNIRQGVEIINYKMLKQL